MRTVDTHESLTKVKVALQYATGVHVSLELLFEYAGYLQGRKTEGKKRKESFKHAHPFGGKASNYNAGFRRKVKYVEQNGEKVKQVVKVDENGEEVAEDFNEGVEAADPMDDEGEYFIVRVCKLLYNTDTHNRKHSDKNPCIEHANLHKTMMQGGGLEVEIIQEPDLRYVECYDRQRERQKREELRELCRYDCSVY